MLELRQGVAGARNGRTQFSDGLLKRGEKLVGFIRCESHARLDGSLLCRGITITTEDKSEFGSKKHYRVKVKVRVEVKTSQVRGEKGDVPKDGTSGGGKVVYKGT